MKMRLEDSLKAILLMATFDFVFANDDGSIYCHSSFNVSVALEKYSFQSYFTYPLLALKLGCFHLEI